jgi:DNA polymerase III delta subunit
MKIDNLEKLKPCYYFISSSASILEEEIENTKKSLKSVIDVSIDFKVFDLDEESEMDDFFNFFKTPSFFSEKKVAVIKNFENVSGPAIKLVTGLLRSSGSDYGTVLFITSKKDVRDKDLSDFILEFGLKKKLISPVSESLKKWVIERAELDGIRFTDKAIARLLENVNYDFGVLKREYQKLYLYIISEKDKTVGEEIVNRLVNRIFDMKIFDMVDFIGKKDKNNALIALKSVLFETETGKKSSGKTGSGSLQGDSDAGSTDKKNIAGLITLLHRMYKAILYYKATGSREILVNYIRKNVGHYPFIFNKLASNYERFSANYSVSALINIFKILAEYDFQLRSNQLSIQPKNLILKMIVELAGQK